MQYRLQAIVKGCAVRSDLGVTAIEYALIAGVTVLAIVAGATAIGINLARIFGRTAAGF
jgi:Flp pilus assembly pilin Flp